MLLHCVWEEIDDLAADVDEVCCGPDGSACVNGAPDECSMACMISVHEFEDQCGDQLEQILGSHRFQEVSILQTQCVDQVDVDAFMDILAEAECPDENGDFADGGTVDLPPTLPPIVLIPAPPGPPAMAGSTMIVADGAMHTETVDAAGDDAWFGFMAIAGDSYEIDTELESPYTLPDSVLQLVGIDQTTILAENDDDPRSTMLYDSFIEWTCPATGIYYVNVHEYGRETGTFGLAITTAVSLGHTGDGDGGGGDPCAGGARMMEDNAIIAYEPAGNYGHDERCTWHIECPMGEVHLTLQAFQTEADYDLVDIFDGADVHAPELAQELSGSLALLPQTAWVSSGSDMYIEFVSDESVADQGFRASYLCQE